MQITINDIIKLKPCGGYPPSRIAELADDRESVTPAEIAALDIPADDRLWVLTRLMTAEQQDCYVRGVASDVLHLWDAPPVVVEWLQTGNPELREAAAEAAAAARAAAAWARVAWDAEAGAAGAAWAAWARAAREAAWAARAAAWAARAATARSAEAAWVAARAAAAWAAARAAATGYNTAMEQYIKRAAEELSK